VRALGVSTYRYLKVKGTVMTVQEASNASFADIYSSTSAVD